MYPEHFTLPFVAGVLIAAAERRRPGLGAWTDASRKELEAVFRAELVDVKRQFFEIFDDKPYWENLEKTLLEVALPRYLAAAEPESALEKKSYGVWRGGDLVSRGAYMAGGLLVGVIMVKVPFIPIPNTWDFFAFLTMLGAPFIPDLQVSFHKRGYHKALRFIVDDMREAAAKTKLYQPLSVDELAVGAPAPVSHPSAEPAAAPAPRNGERNKEG